MIWRFDCKNVNKSCWNNNNNIKQLFHWQRFYVRFCDKMKTTSQTVVQHAQTLKSIDRQRERERGGERKERKENIYNQYKAPANWWTYLVISIKNWMLFIFSTIISDLKLQYYILVIKCIIHAFYLSNLSISVFYCVHNISIKNIVFRFVVQCLVLFVRLLRANVSLLLFFFF